MNNNVSYMRSETPDLYGIKELQNKILEIMVYLDDFCRKNNIKYYLMGGSALGAIRHHGFIPWDDDIDIFIPYIDYLRFQKCCEEQLDKNRFYFQKGDTEELPNYLCKIRMNNTTYIEEGNKNRPWMHQGIFVDVICLNNAAPRGLKRKIQYFCAGLLKAKVVAQSSYKTKNKRKAFKLFIANLIVRGCIKKLLYHQVVKYNRIKTIEVAHVFGRAKFVNSFYPANDFKNQVYVDFEKVQLAVPNGVDDYLKIRYGDEYMKMPDEKTKKSYENHAFIWSTVENYSNFIDEWLKK